MNAIEVKIREAISAARSQDMDSRNRIYLAARAAILNQKNGHVDVSMKALFEGITNIEREFTSGSNETPTQTSKKRQPEPETVSLPIEPHVQIQHAQRARNTRLKTLFNFHDPSQKHIVWALLILSGIGLLLFATYILASASVANRSPSLQDVGVATIFSVKLPSDWEKLTENPTAPRLEGVGNKLVVEAQARRNKSATLYGHKLIAVSPGQEFLMRVEFQSETGGAGPGVRAGFVAYDSNGEPLTKEPENYLYFVESAALGDRYLNDTTGNYVVSGLLITDTTYKNASIPAGTSQIRPFIQILANGNKGKYRISRISVKRID